MVHANVDEILRQIEELSEEDRLVLEARLTELAEKEWKREAEQARQMAKETGIDQAAIDRAVEEIRYSKC
jgi:hypothetical protein